MWTTHLTRRKTRNVVEIELKRACQFATLVAYIKLVVINNVRKFNENRIFQGASASLIQPRYRRRRVTRQKLTRSMKSEKQGQRIVLDSALTYLAGTCPSWLDEAESSLSTLSTFVSSTEGRAAAWLARSSPVLSGFASTRLYIGRTWSLTRTRRPARRWSTSRDNAIRSTLSRVHAIRIARRWHGKRSLCYPTFALRFRPLRIPTQSRAHAHSAPSDQRLMRITRCARWRVATLSPSSGERGTTSVYGRGRR